MIEYEIKDRAWKERGSIEEKRVEVERKIFLGYKPIRVRIYKRIYDREVNIIERDNKIGLR